VGAIAVIVSGVVGLLDGDSATNAIVDIFGGSALLVADLVLVLVGAGVAGELEAGRAQRASIAVAEERRRLARELHDGVAQDLAYIASQSAHLAKRAPDQQVFGDIAGAARRALSESRSVISNLADEDPTGHTPAPAERLSLRGAVEQRASELAARAGLALKLTVDERIDSTPEVDHAVLRILSEAISNAARHAQASELQVSLTGDDESLKVRVCDNGLGFDPTASVERGQSGGYGLDGMRDRVQSLGGELRLESAPGRGTLVEAGF
jgi:signal transduction histidine kinase